MARGTSPILKAEVGSAWYVNTLWLFKNSPNKDFMDLNNIEYETNISKIKIIFPVPFAIFQWWISFHEHMFTEIDSEFCFLSIILLKI